MKGRIAAALSAVLLGLTACGAVPQANTTPSDATQPPQVQILTAEAAHDRMESGDDLVILDVRTAEEYEEAHIDGAVLLPNEDIGDSFPEALPVLDAEILIYCRSGNRSAQAAAKLAALGYTNVFDFGGIRDWPYETVTGAWAPEETAGTLASFSAHTLGGRAVNETVFAGAKLTMVNVWATFCGPCLREMPELGQLAAEYEDRGVQVIGIVADVPQTEAGVFDPAQVSTARELAADTGADYLHLLPSYDLYQAKLREVSSVPETFFVDSMGNVVGKSYVGARSGSDWAAILDSQLAALEA